MVFEGGGCGVLEESCLEWWPNNTTNELIVNFKFDELQVSL